jgi:glycosyltransferase involved in cell wall biosynthesis
MAQSRRPHVVHVVINLNVGGILNLVLGLATSSPLSAWKHSVICLFGARGDLIEAYREAGISLYTCRVHWPRQVRLVPISIQRWIRKQAERTFPWRLAFLLKVIRADVVHTHLPRSIDLIAFSTLQLCRLPLVWSIHGEYMKLLGPEAEGMKKANQMLIHSGRGWVTADSKTLAQDFLKQFPGSEKIVRVVHPGVNIRQFQVDTPRDLGWRRKSGISENAVVFGSCGRLEPIKGFDIFVQAAARLVKHGVDAHFVISGDGDIYEQLSAQITQIGLTDRFHLLGYQENLPYIYKQFDVFVLSSRSEGFPLSLIEALASGLPCIATDVGGVREMVGQLGGVVVPPESPDSLMEAMLLMLEPETRKKFSTEAASTGRKFSVENCASEFANLYSLGLGGGWAKIVG